LAAAANAREDMTGILVSYQKNRCDLWTEKGGFPMSQTATAAELTKKHCKPCEGGVPVLSDKQVQQFLKEVEGWQLIDDGKSIQRQWRLKDFTACLDFFNKVGQIAEEEGHHPDLHLTGYRNARIEITTHAIGGLSENDFILAAKIDQVAPKAKT
jgi:4a-hydroxytetrahydrobiopterin dehydratase